MRIKKRHEFKPSLEGATKRDKGVVVSIQRFRWKEKYYTPSEHMIRMVRFVWMRERLPWADRNKLHSGVLGACLRTGLLIREAKDGKIAVTRAGHAALEADRGA